MSNLKILIVLDGTPALERSHDEFDAINHYANDAFSSICSDVRIETMNKFTGSVDSGSDAEMALKEVDTLSAQLCMDDYDCIIAEGIAAWFWLQARVQLPIVCINPIENPCDVLGDDIDGYARQTFQRIFLERGFQKDYVACIISMEGEDEYNAFRDEQLTWSDESLLSQDFWNELTKVVLNLIDE